MQKTNNNNLTWFKSLVSRKDRERLHGHRGAVFWFTGLSSSGKSTIAHSVEKELHKMGCSTYVFDGDNVRHGLCSDLSFSPAARRENIRRIGEMVKLFVDAGIMVLTAFISPYRSDRDSVRSLFTDGEFFEMYVDCPAEVCEGRDQKGVYKRARSGEIKNFTGISAPYEAPENPELIVRSNELSVEEAVERAIQLVQQNNIIARLATN
jgi:adenylylsulfate kinase